jgi:hypothetical protein
MGIYQVTPGSDWQTNFPTYFEKAQVITEENVTKVVISEFEKTDFPQESKEIVDELPFLASFLFQ